MDPVWLRLAALGLFFWTGAAAGRFCAVQWAGSEGGLLREYLADFCLLYDSGAAVNTFWTLVLNYFGWIFLLLLFGYSPLGLVMVPALAASCGFLSMYAVSCFVCVFDRPGVLVALSAMGIRFLFVLPAFFYLADASWQQASWLAAAGTGKGKRSAPLPGSGGYVVRFLVCVVILAVGVCCERLLVPVLIRAAVAAAL